MILKKNLAFGIFLCLFLFSLSVPLLTGLRSIPSETFTGPDVVVITQTSRDQQLNETLADDLHAQDFVSVASPEIYSFSSLLGEPVIMRGVNFTRFLDIEDGEIVQGHIRQDGVLMGEMLQKRMDVSVGDKVTLVGSVQPTFLELEIAGTYRAPRSSDELLVPLSVGRKLAGISDPDILTIRVRTQQRDTLINYLKLNEYTVMVGDTGGHATYVNENGTEQRKAVEELGLQYSGPLELDLERDSVVSLLIQKGSGSVGIVLAGFIVLNGGLCFIGLAGLFSKGIIEKQRDMGILTAIGANRRKVMYFLLTDAAVITTPAALAGVATGFGLAYLLGVQGLIVAFGRTVRPDLGPAVVVGTLVATLLISCLACLLVGGAQLRSRPRHLMARADPDDVLPDEKDLAEVLAE